MASSHQGQEGHHPTFRQYVLVATILFIITIVEFLLIYPPVGIVEYLGASKIPLLVVLSAVKFAIVILFYMHLHFDNKFLTWVFLSGLGLGFAVVLSLLTLFLALGGEPRAYAQARAVPYDEHAVEQAKEEVVQPTIVPDLPAEKPKAEEPSAQPDVKPPEPDTPVTGSGAGAGSDALIAQGQVLFAGAGGCASCHTVEGVSAGVVGPDLTHLGTEAGSRMPGTAARDYIEESIRNPEAFVAAGVDRAIPGIMTSALTAGLSDDQVASLVEFLLAQK
jgi:mono/diheme cytochrome c family protein/heme/copper-type cytochrome/quinol oxidase subunit 4